MESISIDIKQFHLINSFPAVVHINPKYTTEASDQVYLSDKVLIQPKSCNAFSRVRTKLFKNGNTLFNSVGEVRMTT